MGNLDLYLLRAFDSADEQAITEVREGRRLPDRLVRLPMLVRVTDDFWRRERVPDLLITSRIGNILSCRGSRETLRFLQDDPAVISIEGSRRCLPLDTEQSLDQVKATTVHNTYTENGSECIVAVIDDGIDVLHETFRDDQGNTRILAIWDQTDPTGPHASFTYTSGLSSQIVTCGTVHKKADIDLYIQKGSVPPGLGRNSSGHGTHVASIAAGRSTYHFTAGGIAPGAMLLVVIPELKAGEDDPLSIGYSTSHMDALAYITDFVRVYSQGQGMKRPYPVVVNVSQGMNAGAHDGTSLLEAAFDQFSDSGRALGLAIVKSAGNTRDKHIHARLVMAPNDRDRLEWGAEVEHTGPDVVELWFKACDDLTFTLTDPQNRTLRHQASRSNPSVFGTFLSGNTGEIDLTRYHHDNGDSRLQITVRKGSHRAILAGVWTLGITSGKVLLGGRIHAWIERDDKSPVQFRNNTDQEFTLTIPGTARSVICVSAVDATGGMRALATPNYSAYGSTRDERRKPDIAAPGQDISAAKAGTSDEVVSMEGTSMAAPHVAGAIALLMSFWAKRNPAPQEHLTANQIRAALTQGAEYLNPMWDEKRGYGILDAASLLEAFQ
jgi:subtilisin family serine protease